MLGRAAVTGLGAIVLLGGGAIGAVAATHVGGETPLGSVDMRKADDEPTLILVDDDDGRGGGGGDDGPDQLTNSVSNSAPSVSSPSRSAGDTTGGDTTASNDGTGGGDTTTDNTSTGGNAARAGVTPNDLLIDQRIAQAAVRRANALLAAERARS